MYLGVTPQALKDTIGLLLSSYPTRADEDETLLGLSTLQHPRIRAAVYLRMREQRLLQVWLQIDYRYCSRSKK